MEYRKFEDKFILRIDRGEEVVETIKKFCEEEGVKLGTIQGLGATNDVEIGLFKPSTKEYLKKSFNEDFEMTSIIGNISNMDGEVYLHLHATLGNETYQVFGGHLSYAVVSGTCELEVTAIEGNVDRQFDEDVGLNLYSF